MKTLELNQMEIIHAGTEELASCGQAIVMGTMLGGIFGGVGAALGMI